MLHYAFETGVAFLLEPLSANRQAALHRYASGLNQATSQVIGEASKRCQSIFRYSGAYKDTAVVINGIVKGGLMSHMPNLGPLDFPDDLEDRRVITEQAEPLLDRFNTAVPPHVGEVDLGQVALYFAGLHYALWTREFALGAEGQAATVEAEAAFTNNVLCKIPTPHVY